MSRATATASLLPPLQRMAAPAPHMGGATGRWTQEPAGTALFDLPSLRLLPRPQRAAMLDAETTREAEEETPVQPRLEVGAADDPHEREADAVAEAVARMPAEADGVGVRRKCAACESEEKVQRETAAESEATDGGPPELAASAAKLTGGGAPLAADVRGYYESRLGRDLSGVRVHAGTDAAGLNDEIAARAFTYGSHIWLGAGETAAPSHTLSHELAHVLQQTQPRALRDGEAEPAAGGEPVVQRKSARWVPHKSPTLTRSQGASHDRVVEAISKANADLLAEVPIPNAGRYSAIKSRGFADFVKATPQVIPGVWVVSQGPATPPAAPAKPDPAAAAPRTEDEAETPDESSAAAKLGTGETTIASAKGDVIANFDEDDWLAAKLLTLIQLGKVNRQDLVKPMKGGARFAVAGNQHPRVENDKIVGIAQAPKRMAIGELKPGHNIEAGESAFKQQLPRYREGLGKVRDAVNAVDPQKRDGTWSLTLADIKTTAGGAEGLVVPDGFKPRTAKPAVERELALMVGSTRIPTPQPVRGHLAVGPHPTNAGVWSYLYIPDAAPTARSLTAGQRKSIGKLAIELDKVIRDLKQTPTKVRKTPRRAAETRRAGRRRAAQPARLVRRAPDKAKQRKDVFDRAAWEDKRKKFAADVKAWKASDPEAAQSIEQQAATQEAFKAAAEELKGIAVPPLASQARLDIKLLHRIERVADARFGPLLGILREKFGTIFVRLANAYDGFRERLAERMKKAPADAPKGFGGWKRKALRLLIAAAVTGAKLLAAQVVANFAACLDAMVDRLLAKFEGELEETFEAEIEALTKAFDEVRARIESELEAWFADFDELFATLGEAQKLEPYISAIITSARVGIQVASCVSPPLKGCLWGLVAQVFIDQVIDAVVDTDWFKKAVINPIALGLVTPIADKAYLQLRDLLLGDPNAETLRGRIAKFAAETPQCTPPKRAQMMKWSGVSVSLETADPSKPSDELRGALEAWEAKNADRIDKAIKEALTGPGGAPPSDADLHKLQDAVAGSRLPRPELKKAIDKARKGGKVDAGAATQAVAEAAEKAKKEQGPKVAKVIPAPSSDDNVAPPGRSWSAMGKVYAVLASDLPAIKAGDTVTLDIWLWIKGEWVLLRGLTAVVKDTGAFAKEGLDEFALPEPVHFSVPGDSLTYRLNATESFLIDSRAHARGQPSAPPP